MTEPCFTPRTARRAVDDLRSAAEKLCRLYRELERGGPPRAVSDQPVEPSYFKRVLRLHMALSELRRRGARVQDLRNGALVFPARRAGRRVLLSWRVGEATLDHWHEPGADPEDRRRVDEDGPWEEG